ncbi:pre-peptidase C-terminal domain-containing protein [Massilia sp. W12]|uniref:pre-peptidase C-terminal domain-containing protein n=1 Tax=Massilia sp. W12 TaxID=3126507 RepID=UPI0030D33AD8
MRQHSILLAAASLLCSLQTAQAQELAKPAKVEIGNVEQVIQGFSRQHAEPRSKFVRSLGGDTLGAEIRDYHYKDGRLSITGTAIGNKNSLFILKGTDKKLHGYLALHDANKAFEYSTDANGKVWVEEVKLSKIYPDLDPEFIKSNTPPKNLLAVAHPVYSSLAQGQAPHIGPYANQDLTKLESKPGSPWVFYLDHSAVMSGTTPLNGVSKEQMYRVWQSVADQYSFLKMNVTTNRAVYDAARAANPLRTGIIKFVNQDGRSFAPLHSFGTTAAGTLYRNPSSGWDYGYGIGMTAAHEVGHQMGMNHDRGGSGGEYFEGIAAFQWGPIMGNYWMGGSWANQLFTWSKGEYDTASNFEDDLSIMVNEEKVPYVDDDIATEKALKIGANGAIDPKLNFGQIGRTSDTDTFTFSTTTNSTLNLRIDPIEYLRMLDVEAVLYNAAGQVVARSNLPVHRSAEFVNLSLPAGSYKLVVRGGAEGTPKKGFSNYSSLGWYAMKGSLGGSVSSDPVLQNNVAMTGQGAAAGVWKYYVIDVPANVSKVTFSVNGANGDADMFAKAGARPTSSSYQCKSDGPTSVESCSLSNPAAGRYYLGVYAYSAYSSLSVKAAYTLNK